MESDVASLTGLDASRRGITTLVGLEHASQLVSLQIAGNSISDLDPLSGLRNLRTLVANENRISSLAPLGALTALTSLQIADNPLDERALCDDLLDLEERGVSVQRSADMECPPLEVRLVPDSVVALEGRSAQFALELSGGPSYLKAAWSCVADDTGVALAAPTEVGCEATGVAPGSTGVRVLAQLGRFEASATASLTVVEPEPATLSFWAISSGGVPAPLDRLEGTVDVTLRIVPNDDVITGVSLSASPRGGGEATVVGTQELEQFPPQPFLLTLPFDTRTVPNGAYELTALLNVERSGGTDTVTATLEIEVTIANP